MEQQHRSHDWRLRQWSREAALLLALAALAFLFVVAGFAAGFYRSKRAKLAEEWFAKGDAALKANRPPEAIEDLRNALSFAPANAAYQLRLAQALAAANRPQEAESYLLDLWARQPGSGEINLELARLEAGSNGADAARYYDDAIYGAWESDPDERRWQARMELFQYWRGRGNAGQAQAELLAMAAVTPEGDYQRHVLIGRLEQATGNPRQALSQYQAALRANPRLAAALEGAGAAEFSIGDYRDAISYLESAVRFDPANSTADEQLEVARMVLGDDPFAIGLDEKRRVALAGAAFDRALEGLSACAHRSGIDMEAADSADNFHRLWTQGQQLKTLLGQMRHKPENVLQVMDFVFTVENLAAGVCGPLEGEHQALWLIGRQHHLAETGREPGP